MNDHDALKAEEESYEPIPIIRQVNSKMVQGNYLQIRQEVKEIADEEIESMKADPKWRHLVLG